MTRDTIYHWEPEEFSAHQWESMPIGADFVVACWYCGRTEEADYYDPQECVSPSRKKLIGEYSKRMRIDVNRAYSRNQSVCHECGHVTAERCDEQHGCECYSHHS